MSLHDAIAQAIHLIQSTIAVALLTAHSMPHAFEVLVLCILAGIVVLTAVTEWFL